MRLDLESATQRAAVAEQATARATASTEDLRIKLEEYLADRQEAQTRAASLQAQLDKSREKLSVIAEIQQQLEKLEEASLKSDAIIRRHKDELMEKDELLKIKDSDLRDKNMTLAQKDALIKRLEDQTDTLRRQLEDAAYERSQSESALRSEISRLKNLTPATAPVPAAENSASTGTTATAAPDSVKNTTEKVTVAGAIDYLLDDLPIIERPAPKNAAAPVAACFCVSLLRVSNQNAIISFSVLIQYLVMRQSTQAMNYILPTRPILLPNRHG